MLDGDTALVIVDVQNALDSPRYSGRNNPDLVANLERALTRWRSLGRPVYWVAHDSTEPGSPFRPGQSGNDFRPGFAPIEGETTIRKSVSSAFIGTDFEQQLRRAGVRRLVIGGFQTNNCVEATVRVAADLGFEVTVLADGCSTVGQTDRRGRWWDAEDVHQMALANMEAEYAQVTEIDVLLNELTAQLSEMV